MPKNNLPSLGKMSMIIILLIKSQSKPEIKNLSYLTILLLPRKLIDLIQDHPSASLNKE